MSERKYVIAIDGLGNKHVILFTDEFNHADIRHQYEPDSAGVFEVDGDNKSVVVWGNSATLNVKSKPEDARLIQDFLFSNSWQ